MRTLLAILFLAAQLGSTIYARFVPSRYFCWAPYDAISLYEIEVSTAQKVLKGREALARYRLPAPQENRSMQHVMDVIRQYETTYGHSDNAHVVLRYRTNGRAQQTWHWPRH